jgi:uncharacterized protein (DUF488 family)
VKFLSVGHSTHAAEAFLALLRAHGVNRLADVRTIPQSRRHPHFSREALAAYLVNNGIEYRHMPELGGLRRPRPDSPNGGWQHPAFRGYADHMGTPAFEHALDALVAYGSTDLLAIMCAESKWWQCHRRLIADALVARGHEVYHVMSPRQAVVHEMTPFSRVTAQKVQYPALI